MKMFSIAVSFGFLLSKLSGDVKLPLLGHNKEVPIAVVHSPIFHGAVTRVHVYRDPMPGLAVTRSCKSSQTTLLDLHFCFYMITSNCVETVNPVHFIILRNIERFPSHLIWVWMLLSPICCKKPAEENLFYIKMSSDWDWDWDWGLGLGTGIGDRDWGQGLGTGIGDWDGDGDGDGNGNGNREYPQSQEMTV